MVQTLSEAVHGYTNIADIKRNTEESFRGGDLFLVGGFWSTGEKQSSISKEMLEAAVALGADKTDSDLIKKLRAIIAAEHILTTETRKVPTIIAMYGLDIEERRYAASLVQRFYGDLSSYPQEVQEIRRALLNT